MGGWRLVGADRGNEIYGVPHGMVCRRVRHNELKRFETSRLIHVATASRNALLNRLNNGRRETETLWAEAKSELNRVMKCGVRQVALHLRPELAPVGPRYASAAVGAAGAAGAAVGAVEASPLLTKTILGVTS